MPAARLGVRLGGVAACLDLGAVEFGVADGAVEDGLELAAAGGVG